MMDLSSLRRAVFSFVLGGCALETTAPDPALADASAGDTAVEGDAGPVNPVDTSGTADASCEAGAMPELLAGEGTALGPSLVVYPGRNLVRDGCTTHYGGLDATARFVAPRAGRWTFSALGDDLWSFSAREPCQGGGAERACARFQDYHGPAPFRTPLRFTVRMAAGEALALVADGCQRSRCAWTVQAQMEEPRGCQETDRACPTGQRCVTPPMGSAADSVCEPGHAPELVSVRALRGGRTLRFVAGYRDADNDASGVVARLRDGAGGALPSLDTYLTGSSPDRSGVVRATAVRERSRGPEAVTAVFAVTDSVGLRAERSVPIEDAPVVPAEGRCDPEQLLDLCAEGSGCTSSGVCARFVAPVLREASAFRATTPERSALLVRWDDPNDDVVALELTPLGFAVPVSITLPVYGPSPARSLWSLRLTSDLFRGNSRFVLVARDREGLTSAPLMLNVSAPLEVSAGSACDPRATTSRCPAGTLCTVYGDPLCREALCRPDVRACPRGISPDVLAPTEDLAGAGAGVTTGGAEPAPTSPCDGYLRGVRLHRFTALTAGRYSFRVTTMGLEPGPSLLLRRHCVIGDADSLLGSNGVYHGATAEVSADLTAAEEVYLFVWTNGAPRSYTVAVRRVGAR